MTTFYGYDRNGAQTRMTTQTATANDSDGYEWDFEGHLTRVEKDSTHATTFSYDAGGNRIGTQTRAGTVTTKANYLVDENTAYAQVLEERDASGTLQARYVYGQGYGPLLLQRRQKNAAGVEEVRTRYLLSDGHGSIRQLITESGVVTDSYFYDAWGNALAGGSGNTVNPYRYNGQQAEDAVGGYYLRARYYQPGQGRFLGHDPVLGNSDDPISLHRYLYAGSDGVNACDPSGLEPSLIGTLASLTIRSTLVGAVLGAVYGGGDAYLGGRDWRQGAAAGALGGAVGGFAVALAPILFTAGEIMAVSVGLAGYQMYTAYESMREGLYAQATWRAAWGVFAFWQLKGAAAKTPQSAPEDFLAGLKSARQQMGATTNSTGKRANIASLEGEVGGSSIDKVGVSGNHSSVDGIPRPQDPEMTSLSVGKGNKLFGPRRFTRHLDSESILLEDTLQNTTPQSEGSLNLTSELPVCPSCRLKIAQFRQLRPGITLNVYEGPWPESGS